MRTPFNGPPRAVTHPPPYHDHRDMAQIMEEERALEAARTRLLRPTAPREPMPTGGVTSIRRYPPKPR